MKKTLTLTIEAQHGYLITSGTVETIVADLDLSQPQADGSGILEGLYTIHYTYRWADAVEPAFPACGPSYRVLP